MATKDYNLALVRVGGGRWRGREEGVCEHCEGILILNACSLGCNLHWKGRVCILILWYVQKISV